MLGLIIGKELPICGVYVRGIQRPWEVLQGACTASVTSLHGSSSPVNALQQGDGSPDGFGPQNACNEKQTVNQKLQAPKTKPSSCFCFSATISNSQRLPFLQTPEPVLILITAHM